MRSRSGPLQMRCWRFAGGCDRIVAGGFGGTLFPNPSPQEKGTGLHLKFLLGHFGGYQYGCCRPSSPRNYARRAGGEGLQRDRHPNTTNCDRTVAVASDILAVISATPVVKVIARVGNLDGLLSGLTSSPSEL